MWRALIIEDHDWIELLPDLVGLCEYLKHNHFEKERDTQQF